MSIIYIIIFMLGFIIFILAMKKGYCSHCGRLLHVSRLYIEQASLESSMLDKYICKDCWRKRKESK